MNIANIDLNLLLIIIDFILLLFDKAMIISTNLRDQELTTS
ncbi:hypothetical protein [Romboutsia timonensis]